MRALPSPFDGTARAGEFEEWLAGGEDPPELEPDPGRAAEVAGFAAGAAVTAAVVVYVATHVYRDGYGPLRLVRRL